VLGNFYCLEAKLQFDCGAKLVSLIGIQHFREVTHPAKTALENLLRQGTSDIYLIETFENLSPTASESAREKCLGLVNGWTEEEGVHQAGEAFLVIKRAAQVGAEVWCAEPRIVDTHEWLLQSHPVELLWLDYAINRLSPELLQNSSAASSNMFAEDVAHVADGFVLTLPPTHSFDARHALHTFESVASEILGKSIYTATEIEIHDGLLSPQAGGSTQGENLAQMIADQVQYRERYVVTKIIQACRVFDSLTLVYGASHITSLIKLLSLEMDVHL
jgi:hypothetical protein